MAGGGRCATSRRHDELVYSRSLLAVLRFLLVFFFRSRNSMARKRTEMRSKSGKLLYAVRDAKGEFVDIQTYQRAHADDMRFRSQAELEQQAKAAKKKAAPKKAPAMKAPGKQEMPKQEMSKKKAVPKKAAPKKAAPKKAVPPKRATSAPKKGSAAASGTMSRKTAAKKGAEKKQR
ncbi:MAG TPA: hypothetical protein VFE24_15290 [Pirellulales bacterium]|jgi:low affinity Fe/Cu permease|nr:hypothetical protein [Pirellulales bacterium]